MKDPELDIEIGNILEFLNKIGDEEPPTVDRIRVCLDAIVSYIRSSNDSSVGMCYENILYQDRPECSTLRDEYQSTFDVLYGYAKENMLLIKNDYYNVSFFVEYSDLILEFSELSGQGTISYAFIRNSTDKPFFTLDQFQSNYKFDTSKAELDIAKEILTDYIEDALSLGSTRRAIIAAMKDYIQSGGSGFGFKNI